MFQNYCKKFMSGSKESWGLTSNLALTAAVVTNSLRWVQTATGTKKGINTIIVNTDSDMPSSGSWGCKTTGFEIQTRDLQSMPTPPPPHYLRGPPQKMSRRVTEKITTEHRVWIVFLCCVIFSSAWKPESMCLNIVVLKVAFLILKVSGLL